MCPPVADMLLVKCEVIGVELSMFYFSFIILGMIQPFHTAVPDPLIPPLTDIDRHGCK